MTALLALAAAGFVLGLAFRLLRFGIRGILALISAIFGFLFRGLWTGAYALTSPFSAHRQRTMMSGLDLGFDDEDDVEEPQRVSAADDLQTDFIRR
ncbi:hypothetical protein [Rhodovibrio sodomensis]|uniref:hypothetical protein n=1 Tax=Rhodovibrio sodomensis TaxID=1088 RepID=UPI0019054280|nr:hypothetical protein [Rhodovibrio sodomensis]